MAGRESTQGAVILRFPIERIRPVRLHDPSADRVVDGKVVFLAARSPLRARAIEDGLPPAA
jgi:hypothetical protein